MLISYQRQVPGMSSPEPAVGRKVARRNFTSEMADPCGVVPGAASLQTHVSAQLDAGPTPRPRGLLAGARRRLVGRRRSRDRRPRRIEGARAHARAAGARSGGDRGTRTACKVHGSNGRERVASVDQVHYAINVTCTGVSATEQPSTASRRCITNARAAARWTPAAARGGPPARRSPRTRPCGGVCGREAFAIRDARSAPAWPAGPHQACGATSSAPPPCP